MRAVFKNLTGPPPYVGIQDLLNKNKLAFYLFFNVIINKL